MPPSADYDNISDQKFYVVHGCVSVILATVDQFRNDAPGCIDLELRSLPCDNLTLACHYHFGWCCTVLIKQSQSVWRCQIATVCLQDKTRQNFYSHMEKI